MARKGACLLHLRHLWPGIVYKHWGFKRPPTPHHSVKLATFRVYSVHQRRHILRRSELGNAMAQIENVATPVSVRRQYPCGLAANDFRRRQQHSRVEISLKRHAIANAGTRLSDIDCPGEP